MNATEMQTKPLVVSGNGLITGLPVEVEITRGPEGQGVLFNLGKDEQGNPVMIPARLEAVVHTERGVTLGHPSGKTLSIVEHFLCGVAMAGLNDLVVTVKSQSEPRMEMPLMDGSAWDWYQQLTEHFGETIVKADIDVEEGVFHRLNDSVCVYAVPHDHFVASYAVDYDHPDLNLQWTRWDSATDNKEEIVKARTYGYVRELPALQAMGLAKGVTQENTVGLTDEGGYTTELRMDKEPLQHKILDLMGDLMLMGINPLRLKAHVFAVNAGHPGHTEFAKKLKKVLA